jgi:hypothetical protein
MAANQAQPEPQLIIFFLEIPRPIAIPHGTVYTFVLPEVLDFLKGVAIAPVPGIRPASNLEGNNWASFRFWQVKRTTGKDDAVRPVLEAVVPAESLGLPTERPREPIEPRGYMTIVEASTTLKGPEESEASAAFDACLSALQELLRAYGLSTDHGMPLITRELLPPIAVSIRRTLFSTQDVRIPHC